MRCTLVRNWRPFWPESRVDNIDDTRETLAAQQQSYTLFDTLVCILFCM